MRRPMSSLAVTCDEKLVTVHNSKQIRVRLWSSLPKFPKSFEFQTSINSYEILVVKHTDLILEGKEKEES
jgi:hypothetical protein